LRYFSLRSTSISDFSANLRNLRLQRSEIAALLKTMSLIQLLTKRVSKFWADFRYSVTGNFGVIDPKIFRFCVSGV